MSENNVQEIINKIIEDKKIEKVKLEKELIIEQIKEQIKETNETTIETIKKNTDVDYSKTIREGVLELSSYTMLDNEKRKKFAIDLKKDETLNEYIDEQCYTKWLKTNNPHFKAGIIYSYLYLKNYQTL